MERLSETERQQWRETRADPVDTQCVQGRVRSLTFAEYLEFLRFAERFAPAKEERAYITGGEHWKL